MLFLVRHGRTEANRLGLLQGQSNRSLDEVGQEQAAAVAAAIGTVDRVISSPLPRARQSAARLAEAAGLEVEVDQRWIEVGYGEWEDRPLADVSAETWAQWSTDLDFTPPGGESLREVGSRVRAALDELVADPANAKRDIVIVSHVSPLKAALAWTLGADDRMAWRCRLDTASITRIRLSAHGPVLHAFNETAHLGSLGEG